MAAQAVPATPLRPPAARLGSRVGVVALRALAWLLVRLPDRPLHSLAQGCGTLLYVAQPRRRALVRANLARVCAWLVEHGEASPRVAAAATDRRALDGLVRAAFGHYLRAYLEGLILERYARPALADRVVVDDPAKVERAFAEAAAGRGLIFVGLHFGAIEIPALWTVRRRGVMVTSPMETIGDAQIQEFLLRQRSRAGLRIIPTRGAHAELSARLAAGGVIGLIADRTVGGAGARVELFGAPARLPLGPAGLALETGAPAWAMAVRRTGAGRYAARLEPIPLLADGPRRERLRAFLDSQARIFERLIGDAPEQWWTLFFPIWQQPSATRRAR